MSTSTTNKQELINWIRELEDEAILNTIQSIKTAKPKKIGGTICRK